MNRHCLLIRAYFCLAWGWYPRHFFDPIPSQHINYISSVTFATHRTAPAPRWLLLLSHVLAVLSYKSCFLTYLDIFGNQSIIRIKNCNSKFLAHLFLPILSLEDQCYNAHTWHDKTYHTWTSKASQHPNWEHRHTQCIFRLVIPVRIEPTAGPAKPLRTNMQRSGCHWNVSGAVVLLILLMCLSPAPVCWLLVFNLGLISLNNSEVVCAVLITVLFINMMKRLQLIPKKKWGQTVK